MKTFFTALLALVCLASFAKADRILIYSGYEGGRTNNGVVPLRRYFVLFDLDKLQVVRVAYGGDALGQLYFSVGAPAPFIYAPITTTGTNSQTYFAYSSNDPGPPFNISFRYFFGTNVMQSLGGSFSGEYPGHLVFKDFELAGNGGTIGDTSAVLNAAFDIRPALTKESNASNDDLTAATGLVTTGLGTHGYVQE
jgi:hypothetical protein